MERAHRPEDRELATPQPRTPPALEPGRQAAAPAEPARAGSPTGVPIAPDTHDHAQVPRLRAAANIELRTLVAHVGRALEASERASTEPELAAVRAELQTRCDVAMYNVAPGDHVAFREELEQILGGPRWAAMMDLLVEEPAGVVQRDAAGTASSANIRGTAQRGVASGGGQLPHLAQIQRSFGRHELANVSAHVGGAAAEAALAIGARAYAVGEKVAFSTTPDLRLAAHEAAHVIQQRRGVAVSGGVGRAGDAYEQHADAVADLVVRGESAEALLDSQGSEGAASEAVQLDPLDVLGHYTGREITMQLAQAGTTVVGRIQVHGRGATQAYQTDYDLSVERTPNSDELTGHAGTSRLTMTIHADGTAVVRLRGRTFRLHRDSAAPALSDQTLRAAGRLDQELETAPLTGAQQALLDHLVAIAPGRLHEFFDHAGGLPASPETRRTSLALIDAAVGRLFATETSHQSTALAIVIRTRLQQEPLTINGRAWGMLDWIYAAMAQMPDASMVGNIATRLQIPAGGDASVLDGGGTPQQHCYLIEILDIGSHSLGPVTGAVAYLRVAEYPVPAGLDTAHADPHVRPAGTPTWTSSYMLTRESVTVGFSDSVGTARHISFTTVYTPWPWDQGDFVGPIGGISGGVTATFSMGGPTFDPAWWGHEDHLWFYGTCAFPPIPLDFTTLTIGREVQFGLGVTPEMGQSQGEQSGEMHPHVPVDETAATPVVETREVRLAFETDQADLSSAAQRQLREVLAWRSAVLGDASVDVIGYASRLGSAEHNLELAGRRTTNTMHAIVDAVPALAERIRGETRGEAAAAEAGVVDGDNAQEWRKVEVIIGGQVVLRLYAEVPATISDGGTIPAQ